MLMPAGPACLTPSSCAAAAVTAHRSRGHQGKPAFLDMGFWRVVLFARGWWVVGPLLALALGFCVYVCLGVLIVFFFQQWFPIYVFLLSCRKFHFYNHLLNCA